MWRPKMFLREKAWSAAACVGLEKDARERASTLASVWDEESITCTVIGESMRQASSALGRKAQQETEAGPSVAPSVSSQIA